jgi:hypothetical protein
MRRAAARGPRRVASPRRRWSQRDRMCCTTTAGHCAAHIAWRGLGGAGVICVLQRWTAAALVPQDRAVALARRGRSAARLPAAVSAAVPQSSSVAAVGSSEYAASTAAPSLLLLAARRSAFSAAALSCLAAIAELTMAELTMAELTMVHTQHGLVQAHDGMHRLNSVVHSSFMQGCMALTAGVLMR